MDDGCGGIGFDGGGIGFQAVVVCGAAVVPWTKTKISEREWQGRRSESMIPRDFQEDFWIRIGDQITLKSAQCKNPILMVAVESAGGDSAPTVACGIGSSGFADFFRVSRVFQNMDDGGLAVVVRRRIWKVDGVSAAAMYGSGSRVFQIFLRF